MHFFKIPDSHIGNYDDEHFEQNILKIMNGTGVDLILSTIPEDNSHTFLKVIAQDGRILKIGNISKLADSLG